MTKKTPNYDDILIVINALMNKRGVWSDVAYKRFILKAISKQLDQGRAQAAWDYLVEKNCLERVSKPLRDAGKNMGWNKTPTPYELHEDELNKLYLIIKAAPPSEGTDSKREVNQEDISRAAGTIAVDAMPATQSFGQESGKVSRSVSPPRSARALR